MGDQLTQITLRKGTARLRLLNYGAVTQTWSLMHHGRRRQLILGYDDPNDYLHRPYYMGAMVGRVANRINNAQYKLAGQNYVLDANDGAHCLHGGAAGLSHQYWDITQTQPHQAVLEYTSAQGEGGFGATAYIKLTVTLGADSLLYDVTVTVDCPTPISLAQHNYYNLAGRGQIWTHQFECAADRYVVVDDTLIPTGVIASVKGSRLDFRTKRRFGQADPTRQGVDHCLIFSKPDTQPRARAIAPDGLILEFHTDQPSAQLYTAAGLPKQTGGLNARHYGPASGFCFEPQYYIDAMNQPTFDMPLATPQAPYQQRLLLKITT